MAGPIDVAIWVVKAGWSGIPPALDATHAVAIALAQSSGNPGKSGGLFGIGNVGDGQTQAKFAHDQWAAKGWDVFPAHRNGVYLIFLPAATAAVTAAPVKAVIDDPAAFANGVVSGLKDAAGNLPGQTLLDQAKTGISILTKAGAWLGDENNWARILLVVLGGGMVIGGVTLAAGSSAAGPIAGAAGKLVGGVGKVAKVATKG